jgi:hypothetical protein
MWAPTFGEAMNSMPKQTADNFAARRNGLRRSAGLPIHVLVVDDHPTMRRVLALLAAPSVRRPGVPRAQTPLDCERARRRPRYWVA